MPENLVNSLLLQREAADSYIKLWGEGHPVSRNPFFTLDEFAVQWFWSQNLGSDGFFKLMKIKSPSYLSLEKTLFKGMARHYT